MKEPEYTEGPKAMENFERMAKAIFKAPKAGGRKTRKKSSKTATFRIVGSFNCPFRTVFQAEPVNGVLSTLVSGLLLLSFHIGGLSRRGHRLGLCGWGSWCSGVASCRRILHAEIINVGCHAFPTRQVQRVLSSAEHSGGHDLVNAGFHLGAKQLNLVG